MRGLFPPDARRLACFRDKPAVKEADQVEAIKASHRDTVAILVEEFAIKDRYGSINRALKAADLFPLDRTEAQWVTTIGPSRPGVRARDSPFGGHDNVLARTARDLWPKSIAAVARGWRHTAFRLRPPHGRG